MKFKTTKKEILANYSITIRVGYCNLQNLLNFESPIAYTYNNDGWCCDIYTFGSIAISTGYSPFGTVKPSYDFIRDFDKRAEKANSISYSKPFEERKAIAKNLIDEFIKEATKQC